MEEQLRGVLRGAGRRKPEPSHAAGPQPAAAAGRRDLLAQAQVAQPRARPPLGLSQELIAIVNIELDSS